MFKPVCFCLGFLALATTACAAPAPLGEPAGDGPDEQRDGLRVDALKPRQVGIVGRRLDGLAEDRPVEEDRQSDRQERRQHHGADQQRASQPVTDQIVQPAGAEGCAVSTLMPAGI